MPRVLVLRPRSVLLWGKLFFFYQSFFIDISNTSIARRINVIRSTQFRTRRWESEKRLTRHFVVIKRKPSTFRVGHDTFLASPKRREAWRASLRSISIEKLAYTSFHVITFRERFQLGSLLCFLLSYFAHRHFSIVLPRRKLFRERTLNGTLDRSVIDQIYLSFFPSVLTSIRKMDYILISLFAPLHFFIFLTPFVNLSLFDYGPRTWLYLIFSKTSPIRSSDLSSSHHERAFPIYEKSLFFKRNDR